MINLTLIAIHGEEKQTMALTKMTISKLVLSKDAVIMSPLQADTPKSSLSLPCLGQ